MNVTTYGFTILAARLLGPAEYGALAAVMGLLLVVNVLSLGLQATGARRVSAAPGRTDRRSSARCSPPATPPRSPSGPWCSLASPAGHRDAQPRLTGDAAALIAATAVPLSVMGGQAGHPAGRAPLGAAGRRSTSPSASGGSGSARSRWCVRPDTLGAMVGVTVGALLPVVIGWWRCGTCAAPSGHRAADAGSVPRRPLGEGRGAARDAAQLPRAAGVLRALQRRRGHRPQHARRAPGRPVRRRADPDQGGAVPAPVRGGDRVPVDGQARARAGGCTCSASGRCSRSGLVTVAGVAVLLRARRGVRRRPGVRRPAGPAVGVRACSARCSPCSS